MRKALAALPRNLRAMLESPGGAEAITPESCESPKHAPHRPFLVVAVSGRVCRPERGQECHSRDRIGPGMVDSCSTRSSNLHKRADACALGILVSAGRGGRLRFHLSLLSIRVGCRCSHFFTVFFSQEKSKIFLNVSTTNSFSDYMFS